MDNVLSLQMLETGFEINLCLSWISCRSQASCQSNTSGVVVTPVEPTPIA